jgi:hypothetical protein
MKKGIYYVTRLNRFYIVADKDKDGFATETNNKEYPLFWWSWWEFDEYWSESIYLGKL